MTGLANPPHDIACNTLPCSFTRMGPPPQRGRSGRRRELRGIPGRGTSEKDKPPVLGLIQRGGPVVLRMLANVQQRTIEPVITGAIAQGPLIHTDEYGIYARLPAWGY